MPSPWLCDYPKAICRRCGFDVVWLKTEKGKSIPLDPGWVRRKSEREGVGLTLYMPSAETEGLAVVSAGPFENEGGYSCHIATCSGAPLSEQPSPSDGTPRNAR